LAALSPTNYSFIIAFNPSDWSIAWAGLTVKVTQSASISPGSKAFDKAAPADVTTDITWNDAASVADVKAGGVSIGAGNYSVSPAVAGKSTLTILQGYLAGKTTGSLPLTIEFDKGAPATLTVAVSQSPSISPVSAVFDKASPADVTTTIDLGDAASFKSVWLDGYDLPAAYYSLSGNTLTIKKEYLAIKLPGKHSFWLCLIRAAR
jgi:hypothetical protein